MKWNLKLFSIMGVLLIALAGCAPIAPAAEAPSAEAPAGASAAPAVEIGPAPAGWEIPEGTFPITSEPVTLRVFARQTEVEDFNTSLFTQWYEEQTGVHVEWMVAPSNEANEKLNLMLASGDLPDVILFDLTPAQQALYGEQGLLVPLNDLIEQHGTMTKQVFEEFPEMQDRVTAPNGSIYGLPEVNQCYHCSTAQKMWIYQPWLDKLGLAMPTTTDEFYTVLKAFKEQDPNGNGEADEIPLATTIDMWNGEIDRFLMNSFLLNPEKRLVLTDGKIDVTYNKPEWREGLLYLHKLYADGLLAPESFTQNAEQLKLLANGETPVLGALNSALSGYIADWGTPRNLEYVVVPPLKGPTGLQVTPYISVYGGGRFYITNAAQNPEVAFRWGDALYIPEVGLRDYYGAAGQNWTWAEAGEVGIDGRPAVFKTLEGGPTNAGWSQASQSLRANWFRFGEKQRNDTDVEVVLYQQTKKMEPYRQAAETVVPTLFFTNEQAQTIADAQATIDKYVLEMLARFVTGDADVEAEWDTYVQTLDEMGLPAFLETYQAAYDAKYKQ